MAWETVNGRVYFDTQAIRDAEKAGARIDHIGYGDFRFEAKEGAFTYVGEFLRASDAKLWDGQSGRAHQVTPPEAREWLKSHIPSKNEADK